MDIFALVIFNNVLSFWLNIIIPIAIVLLTIFYAGKIIYWLGLDGLDICQQFFIIKNENKKQEIELEEMENKIYKGRHA